MFLLCTRTQVHTGRPISGVFCPAMIDRHAERKMTRVGVEIRAVLAVCDTRHTRSMIPGNRLNPFCARRLKPAKQNRRLNQCFNG